jgi:excisionase family DNA binding protein
MPYRILNIEEAAAYLNINVSELKELVKNGEIPFEQRGNRIVFKKGDIDDWGSKKFLGMESVSLKKYHQTTTSKNLLSEEALMPLLLKVDYISPALTGKTKPSIIREMAKLADKTGLISDIEELTKELIEREELCSTGLPGGIAILHTRTRHPYMYSNSFLAVGRSLQKIYFGAPDGETNRPVFFDLFKRRPTPPPYLGKTLLDVS